LVFDDLKSKYEDKDKDLQVGPRGQGLFSRTPSLVVTVLITST